MKEFLFQFAVFYSNFQVTVALTYLVNLSVKVLSQISRQTCGGWFSDNHRARWDIFIIVLSLHLWKCGTLDLG